MCKKTSSALQISSLQSQIRSKETNIRSQEDEVDRTKMDLSRLQDEESQLEQRLLSGRVQLDGIVKSLKTTQEEITQVRAFRQTSGASFMNNVYSTKRLCTSFSLHMCYI